MCNNFDSVSNETSLVCGIVQIIWEITFQERVLELV